MGESLCHLVKIDVKTFVSDEEEANPFSNVTDIIYLLSQLAGASFRSAHTRYPFYYRVTKLNPCFSRAVHIHVVNFQFQKSVVGTLFWSFPKK